MGVVLRFGLLRIISSEKEEGGQRLTSEKMSLDYFIELLLGNDESGIISVSKQMSLKITSEYAQKLSIFTYPLFYFLLKAKSSVYFLKIRRP